MKNKMKMFAVTSGIAACGVGFIPFVVGCNSDDVKYINHRGLSSRKFENTADAFTAAGKNKSTFGIETDIYLTIDNTLVCSHDINPFRKGNGTTPDDMKRDAGYMNGATYESGECNPANGYWDFNDPTSYKITGHSWNEIKDKHLWTGHTDFDSSTNDYEVTTDCYNHYGIEGNYTVPKLSEYLSICKKYNKEAVIEIKDDGAYVLNQTYVDALINRLVTDIDESGWIKHCTIIGFDDPNFDTFGEKGPFYKKLISVNTASNNKYQLLVNKFQKLCWEDKGKYIDPLSDAYRALCLGMNIDVDYHFVTSDLVKFAHQQKKTINCWTVNEKADADKLKTLGVDQITTNMVF